MKGAEQTFVELTARKALETPTALCTCNDSRGVLGCCALFSPFQGLRRWLVVIHPCLPTCEGRVHQEAIGRSREPQPDAQMGSVVRGRAGVGYWRREGGYSMHLPQRM